MLAGLMSRCTIPLACADSSASAIWIADVEQLADLEALPRQPLRQRLALEQLHDDEVLALVLLDRVDRADARVVQRRRRARLALESLQRLRVVRQLVRAGT